MSANPEPGAKDEDPASGYAASPPDDAYDSFRVRRLLPIALFLTLLPCIFFAIAAVNQYRGASRDSDAVMGWQILGLMFLIPALFAGPAAAMLGWRAWQARNRGRRARGA